MGRHTSSSPTSPAPPPPASPAASAPRRKKKRQKTAKTVDPSAHPASAEEHELAALVFGPPHPTPPAPAPTTAAATAASSPDDGPDDSPTPHPTPPASASASAWIDDADQPDQPHQTAAALVSLPPTSRSRKLRESESEAALPAHEYERRLRRQYERMHPGATAWAAAAAPPTNQPPAAPRTTASTRPSPLPPSRLEVTRLRDANAADPADAVLRSVEFHPSSPLLLTASLDRTLRLFRVDGASNPKLQGVHFEDMPISRAAFAGSTHVVCSGRRPFFYVYDMQAAAAERVGPVAGVTDRSLETFALSRDGRTMATLGSGGVVNLLNLRTRSLAGSLRMSGTARSLCFSADGERLMAAGGDGAVLTWDLRTRRVLGRAVDEGSSGATALAASPDGAHYATGGEAGVVNLYEDPYGPGGAAGPAPARSFMNLTTTVDTLAFSADGSVLACASRMKKDALRLVHVPTRTVFSNWPTSRSPLQFVHSCAFSPGGAYFAVGNARGRALLYRLHHYDAA